VAEQIHALIAREGTSMTALAPEKAVHKEPLTISTRQNVYTIRYTLWCLAIALLFWGANDLDRIFNLYIFLIPVLAVPTFLVGTALVVSLVLNLRRRHRRCVLSILAAPVLAGLLLSLVIHFGLTTSLIRLELRKPTYLAQVAKLPVTGNEPRLKIWDWGSTGGVAVVNISYFLVYDESDQIALPSISWSSDWKKRALATAKGTSFLTILDPQPGPDDRYCGNGCSSITDLDGHFYAVTQIFD
jgi:hypothetical protein